jgi:hypothetical protein
VDFKLVDGWFDGGVFEQVLQVSLQVVADSDVSYLPLLLQLHQGTPTLPPDLSVFLAPDRLLAYSRPVDDH